VRAVKISTRLIERASDTRSRSCASQHSRKGSPGFSLLSERHGEGAAAHRLELSSQALGLFQVCHGDGLGGFHCRLGRRRLGALFYELGVFAGEGRLEELCDRKARPVAGHDGHDLFGHRSSLAMVGGSLD
jgi:hypothetical protein